MADEALLPGGDITGLGNASNPWSRAVVRTLHAAEAITDGTRSLTVAELRAHLDDATAPDLTGVMLQTLYDPDADGKVASAVRADSAATADSALAATTASMATTATTAATATTAQTAAIALDISGASEAGALKYYGTDQAGAPGFYDLPAGESGGTGGTVSSVAWSAITGTPEAFAPATHATTHAAGGSDPLTPSVIGAAALSHTHVISGVDGLSFALEAKAEHSHTHATADVNGLLSALEAKAALTHAHDAATATTAGFFAPVDKSKLDGIEAGAQANRVTSVNGMTGAVILDKEAIGLGSVDNTADADKPVSSAVAAELSLKASANALTAHTGAVADAHAMNTITGLVAALSAKASMGDLSSHTANASNPHGVTAAQVGAATAAHIHPAVEIALSAANWSSGTYTIACTVPNTAAVEAGLPCPTTEANRTAAANAGLWVSAATASSITIKADTTPTSDIVIAVKGVIV